MNVIHHINRRKEKNHIILSTDAEKPLDKIQHSFVIKTLNKVVTGGTYFNIIKAVYKGPTVNIILNGETLPTFAVQLRKTQRYPSHHYYFT